MTFFKIGEAVTALLATAVPYEDNPENYTNTELHNKSEELANFVLKHMEALSYWEQDQLTLSATVIQSHLEYIRGY